MPREPWRDDPEYLGLWRMSREQPDERAPHLVLSDWLEEHGHNLPAWRERLHGVTGTAPAFDADEGTARAGFVPMGEGAWRRMLAAPPSDDLLCVFDRDVQAYQYLRQYRGRCGWNLGQCDWSSKTERAHLLAVPRLRMLACELIGPAAWDWILDHMPNLLHFEATSPQIDVARLAGLMRMPQLRALTLRGNVAIDVRAVTALPGLRHLAFGPFYIDAAGLAQLAPGLESLHADVVGFSGEVLWPNLRSLQMLPRPDDPVLTTADVIGLSRYSRLERLDIRCGRVTAAAIAALAELSHLRELTLRFQHGHPVPPLKGLSKAAALESLTIEGPVNASRRAEIGRLRGLRSLSLSQVAAGNLNVIADLPGLEEVQLYGEAEDTTALTALAALPRLEKLDVKYLTMPAGTAQAVKAACPPWVVCDVPSE